MGKCMYGFICTVMHSWLKCNDNACDRAELCRHWSNKIFIQLIFFGRNTVYYNMIILVAWQRQVQNMFIRFSLPRPHGPLARYVKLCVAHAPGLPGMFSPPPRVSDPDLHHGTCVTHVHTGIANLRFPLKSVAGKMFSAFPSHAQHAIFRIW